MAASTPGRELRWAFVFFAIFAVLMLVLGPLLRMRGVPGFISDVMIGMLSAISYIVLRSAIARRRRLLSGK